jgi:FkbM family methyltransferase
VPPLRSLEKNHDSRVFKHLRRWLAGTRGMRSKHGASFALDILAANGIAEIAIPRADGRLVHLSTSDKVIASSVLRTGSFGRENMDAFAGVLADAGLVPAHLTFVNVGANIGTACLNAYDAGFRNLIAVEPEPRNFSLLERNVDDLPGTMVRCIRCAVGEAPGKASLHRHPTNLGSHSLLAPSSAAPATDTVEVAIGPLSEIVAPAEPFVLFVDVEGFEPQVLRGGEAAIAADCQAIVLEITPARYSPGDTSDLCSRLERFSPHLVLLPSGARHPTVDLGRLMADRHTGHFDIALVRG